MDIKDFLPQYPSVNPSEESILNPYKDNFYEVIFRKKEFYENKLDKVEIFPNEKGMLTKYQKTIARYMSSHTPYERLLLVHFMGSGKCVLPGTKIYVNNDVHNIEDLWNYNRDTTVIFDEEGEWAFPNKTFFVDSYDEKLGTMIKAPINKFYRQYVKEPVRKITLQGGHTITMTKRHKIMTEKGWTNDFTNIKYAAIPKKLAHEGSKFDDKLAEKIHNSELNFAKILSIEEFDYEGWVYDLEIEEHHNYIANGILTHNTCSAIGAIEQIRSEDSTFQGALILARGPKILENFTRELVEKCTAGQYMPANYNKLSRLAKTHRVKKMTNFYQMDTFIVFGKQIRSMSDAEIIERYSNRIIVIDEVHNLRIQSDDDEAALETYQQFHRFLHTVKNCKVLLLSGTPMKDSPEEIAAVANLLLPLDDQFPTGNDFLEEYMVEEDRVYRMIPEKAEEFKQKLKGYISFLREAESSIKKNFIGVENYDSLKHLIVDPKEMSDFQTEHYRSAWNKDTGKGDGNEPGKKKGVWINTREASLFVYPDGSYGRKGFEKYIEEVKSKVSVKKEKSGPTTHRFRPELRQALTEGDDILTNINNFSCTYANVIQKIMETQGNCFVYSSLVHGSGAITFCLLLELLGFSRANGNEREQGLRYSLITQETPNIRGILDLYNSPKNRHGDYIKVIVGSRTISEAFSLRNVIFEAILTPHWNYSETAQALARGIRLGSHNDLADEKPSVSILQAVAVPNDGTPSLDLHMYVTSEDKDITIHGILRLLMEVAFDCALNYLRNNIEGADGSRECDYTYCNYGCDGMDMRVVENGLDDADLDFSTYQLYYANPKIPAIRRKIEKLFRENNKLDLDSIVKNLTGKFTEEEIRNALFTIQEESESEEFDYKTFLRIYSRSPVKQIMNRIEELFRQFFRLDLQTIYDQFPEYTKFEVLTALQNIINDSMVVIDKYGLPSYLREENDVYFLVNSLSVQPDFFTEYYTSNPHITTGRGFDNIMNRVYSRTLPQLVDKICRTQNETEFIKLMKSLPISVQELFIEASLVAKNKGIDHNVTVRDNVLKFFGSYIKTIDNVQISTFPREGDEIIRCLEVGADINDWKDCDDRYEELVRRYEIQREQKLREENEYGLMGKWNPEKNIFCIVDFSKEKKSQTKTAEKRQGAETDARLLRPGKNCKSWTIPDLLSITVKRLKIEPPEDFRRAESIESMKKRIKEDKHMAEIYTPEEFEELDKNDLRRILYWGTPKSEKGMRGNEIICQILKKWFEDRGLLEIDMNCGRQGKTKIGVEKAPKKTKDVSDLKLRIESFIPSKDSERFSAYKKDISKLMGECFGTKKFNAPIDDNLWIMVFSKSKLVGFIMIDEENILWNVCVAKYYRKKGIAAKAMSIAVQHVCGVKRKNPTLQVDNRAESAQKLITVYTSYGFKVDRSDEKITYMSHDCS